jgi:hypothetical protein
MATKLATISTFVAVYDHLTTDFGGVTPIAMVESAGTGWANESLAGFERSHKLNIYIWWEWTDANEDRVDDLSEDVFDLFDANLEVAGAWSSLLVDDLGSSLAYSEPDENGKVYRIELIPVVVW